MNESRSPVTLASGASTQVVLATRWDAGPRRFAPLSTVSETCAVELIGKISSSWSARTTAVITDDIGLSFAPGPLTARTTVGFSAQRGSLTWWVEGGRLVLVVLALLLWPRRRRLHPALSGVLMASGPGVDGRLALRGRSAALSAGPIGLPGYGSGQADRAGIRASEIVLRVTYSRDGSPAGRADATIAPGGSTTVEDITFTWRV